MSDNTRLDDEVRVIAEFGDVSDGTSYVEHGMAREILRLRRILAALRESSDGVQKAAMWEYWSVFPGGRNVWSRTIRAAVKAAEQEVGP